ncbi:hypothetical protein CPB84DRAFT_1753076 [Gymnopilus junonius]|uniref:Uncharacterized protein n=1 Tax=Gymnopilus junonius TaxID=109634 RepID=A0A9P5TFD1_GYMJU|nr:hypothetical protein CPB84DRAFT_1753076 [Gymnopilus junonius]
MFSVPPEVIAGGELENAVDPGDFFTLQSFEDLCTYLFLGPKQYPNTEEFLINILKLSSFLDIEDGVAYTVDAFERRGCLFHPALQLSLAKCYDIASWVEPAFRKLIYIDLSEFSLEHSLLLGVQVNYYLGQARNRISQLYRAMAYQAPDVVHEFTCTRQLSCEVAWKNEWEKFAKHLVHPEVVITGTEVANHLRT